MEDLSVDQNGTLQARIVHVPASAQWLPPPMKTQRRRAPVKVVHRPITRSMTRAARMQVLPLSHQPVPPKLHNVPEYSPTLYPSTVAHGAHRRRRTLLKPRNLRVHPRTPHSHQRHAKSTHRCKRNTPKSTHRCKRNTPKNSMFQGASLNTPSPTYASPVSPAQHPVSHAHTSSYVQQQGQMHQFASPVSPSPQNVSRAHTSSYRQHQGHTSPHEYVSPASAAPHNASHAHTSSYKQQQGQASPHQYASPLSPASPHHVSQVHASRSPYASPQQQHQGLSPHRVRGGHFSPYPQHQGQGSPQQYISPAPHHASHMHTSPYGQHQDQASPQRHKEQVSPQTSPHHGKATPHQHLGRTSPQQKHGSLSPRDNQAHASPYEVFCKEQQRKAFVQSILPSKSPVSPRERSPTSRRHGSEHAHISGNGSGPSHTSTVPLHVHAAKSGKRTHSVTNELEQQASKVMRITHQERSNNVSGAIAGSSPLHASQKQQASRSASPASSALPLSTTKGIQQQAPSLQQHLPRVQQMPAQASQASSSYVPRTQLPSHHKPSAQQASRQPQQVLHRGADYSDQTFFGQASSLASSIIPGLNNTSPPHHIQKAPQTGSTYNTNKGPVQSIPASPQYMQHLQALQAHMAQQRVMQQPQQPVNARDFHNVQPPAPSVNSFTSGAVRSYPSGQLGVGGHTTYNHPNGNAAHNSMPRSPRAQQSSPNTQPTTSAPITQPTTSAAPQSSSHLPTTSSPSPSHRNSGQSNMINAHGTSQSNQSNHGPSSTSSLSSQQPSSSPDNCYHKTPGLQYMHP